MKARTLTALALGAVALAACGTSRGPDGQPERLSVLLSTDAIMFGTFDTNADFLVSNAEVEAGIVQEWARMDANSDGSVSPIEYQNWSNLVLGGGQLPPYRLDFDRNVDNIITQEEFRTELLTRAREYDSNEDGSISRAEFVRNLNTVRPGTQGPPTWRAEPRNGRL